MTRAGIESQFDEMSPAMGVVCPMKETSPYKKLSDYNEVLI